MGNAWVLRLAWFLPLEHPTLCSSTPNLPENGPSQSLGLGHISILENVAKSRIERRRGRMETEKVHSQGSGKHTGFPIMF